MLRRPMSIALALILVLMPFSECLSASKVKLRGYITDRPDAQSVMILDDVIHFASDMQFHAKNEDKDGNFSLDELVPGVLIEAEGTWDGKHNFAAQKITCDAAQFDKRVHGVTFLDGDPDQAEQIASGEAAELRVDGELLTLDKNARRDWKAGISASAGASGASAMGMRFAGRKVVWEGTRRTDGKIAIEKLELASTAPADAYKNPDDIRVVKAKDPQTGIDILEFKRGKKVEGRMKLFPVKEVQDYVSELGLKLLPAGANVTARSLEFRFFVVEDAHINAATLPDGTMMVNTGLLASVDDEASLAFVLSHEISHVLQAHYWREQNDRVLLKTLIKVGTIAGKYYIGDLAEFLGYLGMAAVVNGYSRNIENQADRIGMQNIIEKGFDPKPAVGFFRILIDRYSDRSTSALWSDHENSMIRGSFLSIQLSRQYPAAIFENKHATSDKFKQMKENLGYIKIM
jgi:hypothetical protein